MDLTNKSEVKKQLIDVFSQIKKTGLKTFKSGEWLLPLIHNAFESYYNNANAEFFRKKYPGFSDDQIIKKITSVAATNASILGGVTGAVVSANDIALLIAAAGTAGLNLPTQVTLTVGSVCAEAILLIRIQLQLIAEIAKIMGVPLDPHDPEDALIILSFALGGSASEIMGKVGAKAGGKITGAAVKKYISGATLTAFKKVAAKLGYKLLQKNILKYAVPGAAIVIGAFWNRYTTKAVHKRPVINPTASTGYFC